MPAVYLRLFFFQAEDGIRDLYVTGVQTCALPISARGGRTAPRCSATSSAGRAWGRSPPRGSRWPRSEERRVGKECGSRWSPEHEKKEGCKKGKQSGGGWRH